MNAACLVFSSVILFSSAMAQDPGRKDWKTFTDTAGKFTAQYPPAWTNKIKEGNRVFFTSPSDNAQDRFHENINIHVSQNPGFGTTVKIQDMCPAILEKLKPSFSDFKSESQRFFQWNKTEACEIVYSGYNKIDESIKVRMTQWFCFYKTRLYTVTFTAAADNPSHDTTARNIMSSILFK